MDKLFDLIEDNKEVMKDQLYKDLIEAYGEALKETSYAKIWRLQPIDSGCAMHFTDRECGLYVAGMHEDLGFRVSQIVVPKDSEWYKCAVANTVKARQVMAENQDDEEQRRARYKKMTMKELRKALLDNNVHIPTQIQGKRMTKAWMIDLALKCPIELDF